VSGGRPSRLKRGGEGGGDDAGVVEERGGDDLAGNVETREGAGESVLLTEAGRIGEHVKARGFVETTISRHS